jgi:hypothetical protein
MRFFKHILAMELVDVFIPSSVRVTTPIVGGNADYTKNRYTNTRPMPIIAPMWRPPVCDSGATAGFVGGVPLRLRSGSGNSFGSEKFSRVVREKPSISMFRESDRNV